MNYSVREISDIVNGEVIGNPNLNISEICFDSRKVSFSKGSAFVAIQSKNSDGHEFVKEAYSKGISVFIVSEPIDIPYQSCILVNNTLEALQKLSEIHRKTHKIKVIGITGSNGKTTVKERLFQVLKDDHETIRSPKSYNSQIGVPLSILKIEKRHEIGLFEAGISKIGEMSNLQKIILPEVGVLTHIGDAHDSGFRSRDEKIKEKLSLFKQSKVIIYPFDLNIAHFVSSVLPSIKAITWSRFSEGAGMRVLKEVTSGRVTEITLKSRSQQYNLKVPSGDMASIDNTITAVTVLDYLGVAKEVIEKKVKSFLPLEMRLKIEEGINDCVIINDTYNADWDSLRIALDHLGNQGKDRVKIAILSDIEHGGEIENHYTELKKLIAKSGVKKFIGIGPNYIKHRPDISIVNHFFSSTKAFLKGFRYNQLQKASILIKGRRSYEFERITESLKKSTHESVLEVDLNAIIHNFNQFKSKLKPGVKILVMVKAFSYGSGSYEIAKVLQYHNVDYLGVAYVDEGIELRARGITLPIIVMNPDIRSFEHLINHDLEPEIFDQNHLNELVKLSKNGFHEDKIIKIHVKLESGMNRLGLKEDDISNFIEKLKSNRQIEIASIFTHLAESGNIDKEYTTQQLIYFEQKAIEISQSLKVNPLHHVLNTDGIINYPDNQFNMVRLGIGIYGYCKDEDFRKRLEIVSHFKTRVSHVKNLSEGETVGYNRSGRMVKDGKIAVLPVGYADGLDRRLGNGNWSFQINGEKYPTIGDICMDMCMILVNDNVSEGDEVTVFGLSPSIVELSTALNTIPYEIMTRISARVRRIYFSD